jgi:hypothetical protein
VKALAEDEPVGWRTSASRRPRATDVEALQRALEELAELELASRGNTSSPSDTAALRAIDAITAGQARRRGARVGAIAAAAGRRRYSRGASRRAELRRAGLLARARRCGAARRA